MKSKDLHFFLNSPLKDTILFSLLIKISGWITLFILNWKIGVAIFIILIGDKIQRNLIDRINLNTTNSIIATLNNMLKINDDTSKIDNDISKINPNSPLTDDAKESKSIKNNGELKNDEDLSKN